MPEDTLILHCFWQNDIGSSSCSLKWQTQRPLRIIN